MEVSAVAATQVAQTQMQVQTALAGRLLKLALTTGDAQYVPTLIEQVAETAAAINRESGDQLAGRLDAYA